MDAHRNFAYSTVATAPSPASSGTSLVVASGDGSKFPAAPFNATVWPANSMPTAANAEIVRVTAISTDTFTITRAQESSSARSIGIGDQIAAAITAKTLTDVEAATSHVVAHATKAATVSTSATTAATGAALLASDLSFTADGSSDYLVVVTARQIANNTGLAASRLELFLDGSDVGTILDWTAGGSNYTNPLNASSIIIAPAGGAHTVNVRLWVNSGTATIAAGAGGTSGSSPPIVVQVVKLA